MIPVLAPPVLAPLGPRSVDLIGNTTSNAFRRRIAFLFHRDRNPFPSFARGVTEEILLSLKGRHPVVDVEADDLYSFDRSLTR